ncbi:MAG TPA: heme-binding protein [Kofleriaceae bacterium]|nr:heme-binding protein [Kofleriaceae bacterium]
MQTTTPEHAKPLPSVFDYFSVPAPQPKTAVALRKVGLWSTLVAVPAAYALGRALGSRRTGVLAGGLALLGIGVVRWQLARWFEETPAYETLGRAGELELRSYPFRLEAYSEMRTSDLEAALHHGYSRLECYVYGANAKREPLACSTPFLTVHRDGVFLTSLVMPPGRELASLPPPSDHRVELREVPERRIAVYPFRGRFTQENFAWQERKLLRSLVDAGLVARGSVTLATYDGPTTLPALRRNELWIEVV